MRRQLPAHSPISTSALAHGLTGALGLDSFTILSQRLEQQFSARAVLLTNSGTTALTLALAAAGGPDGLIALPAYACYDLATAADGARSRVVLYDVDPITLAPEPASLERALAHRPRAVVAVHLYGLPVDTAALREICARSDAVLIEDAAQAIGASVRGVSAGGHGSLGLLSFGRGKGISGGGGGALIANDEKGAALLNGANSLLAQAHAGWTELGRAGAQWLLGRPATYGAISALPFLHLGETIYHAPRPLRSLSRVSSRIVAQVWASAYADANVRRANAERLLLAARRSARWRTMNVAPDCTPGYLRFPLLPANAHGGTANMAQAARLGVMPGYPLPLSQLRGFREGCINANESFPGAELLAARLLTLPTHSQLTGSDLADLEAWLEKT